MDSSRSRLELRSRLEGAKQALVEKRQRLESAERRLQQAQGAVGAGAGQVVEELRQEIELLRTESQLVQQDIELLQEELVGVRAVETSVQELSERGTKRGRDQISAMLADVRDADTKLQTAERQFQDFDARIPLTLELAKKRKDLDNYIRQKEEEIAAIKAYKQSVQQPRTESALAILARNLPETAFDVSKLTQSLRDDVDALIPPLSSPLAGKDAAENFWKSVPSEDVVLDRLFKKGETDFKKSLRNCVKLRYPKCVKKILDLYGHKINNNFKLDVMEELISSNGRNLDLERFSPSVYEILLIFLLDPSLRLPPDLYLNHFKLDDHFDQLILFKLSIEQIQMLVRHKDRLGAIFNLVVLASLFSEYERQTNEIEKRQKAKRLLLALSASLDAVETASLPAVENYFTDIEGRGDIIWKSNLDVVSLPDVDVNISEMIRKYGFSKEELFGSP